MERLDRINKSKKTVWALGAVLFLFALALNLLTPYVADDYVYRLGFHDKEPVESLGDVAKSMVVHSYRMNGRVVSHFFGQLFMLWPKAVFDAVNAAALVGLVLLSAGLAGCGGRRTALVTLATAMAFWKFCPVFGQVALWQLGSVNYLWGLLGGVAFLGPYAVRFMEGREALPRVWQRVLFCLFALIFGAYIEVMSFIALFLGAVLLALSRLLDKKTLKSWLVLPLVLGLAGYLVLMSMPAELAAKQSSPGLSVLLANFAKATAMLETYGLTLILVWLALLAVGLRQGGDRRRLILSAAFALGAVAANYMLTFAAYYEPRCASPTVLLLILACVSAALALDPRGLGGTVRSWLCCALAAVFLFSLVSGCAGIYQSWAGFRDREARVARAVEAGETDLTLPVIRGPNPYSAFWGLLDLNTETRDTWPNNQMAEYFGVESILGE